MNAMSLDDSCICIILIAESRVALLDAPSEPCKVCAMVSARKVQGLSPLLFVA